MSTHTRSILCPKKLVRTEGRFRIASVKTARDINRRVLLELIRKHQPISRADLARQSLLQRSTVSSITEQLIAERWVTIGDLADIPRGRKPTSLHLNGDRAAFFGIDVHPSETIIAIADLNLRFIEQTRIPTHRNARRFIKNLCDQVQRMIEAHAELTFEGIGIALPGRIDLASGRLAFAPNLSWGATDLKTPVEAATGLPVKLENAANVCALAEMWSGRHSEEVRNLVAVTVSEGIGVGMICNGQIVKGSTGFAGEFGHVTLLEDGPRCNCGNLGCWEACASNSATLDYYNQRVAAQNRANAQAPDFASLLSRAQNHEPPALEALNRMAQFIGQGITILINGLSPDVIVLVGEVTNAWEIVSPVIKKAVMSRQRPPTPARILPTNPHVQPRLSGAVALMMQKHFAAHPF
jgi:predicted NBD/HSP70 family sugar kinase